MLRIGSVSVLEPCQRVLVPGVDRMIGARLPGGSELFAVDVDDDQLVVGQVGARHPNAG